MTEKLMNETKTAWVAGANGLVGQSLLRQLDKHPNYDSIVAFVRQAPKQKPFKKVRYFVCDWHALLNSPDIFTPPTNTVDDLFCALGSTKKKTPIKSDYYRIDVEMPIAFGKLGKSHGARYYGVVSAHGAKSGAFSSYLKMKGVMEAGVQALEIDNVTMAQPSLLLGDRGEFRLGEKAGEAFLKLLPGNLRAIWDHDVAAALINAAATHRGYQTLRSAKMQGSF